MRTLPDAFDQARREERVLALEAASRQRILVLEGPWEP